MAASESSEAKKKYLGQPPGWWISTLTAAAIVENRDDPDALEIGTPIRLEFRRVSWDGEAGVIFYGHKAVGA